MSKINLSFCFQSPKRNFDNSLCMKKERLDTNSHKQPFSFNNDYVENKKMVKNRSLRNISRSPREEEKEKLINILSQPKTENLGTKKITNTARVSKLNNSPVANDEREKEKDRLAAIFASSTYQYSKPSNHELSKNLNSILAIKSNGIHEKKEPGSFLVTKSEIKLEEGESLDNTVPIDEEKSLRNKYNIPEISISEYHSDSGQSELTVSIFDVWTFQT